MTPKELAREIICPHAEPTTAFEIQMVKMLSEYGERLLASQSEAVQQEPVCDELCVDHVNDAERWRWACENGWPEFCSHWQGSPTGMGWYHEKTGTRRYGSANAAIDAARGRSEKEG